jgi:lactoylglutathione lyase
LYCYVAAVSQTHSFGLKACRLFKQNGNSLKVMSSGNVSSSVTAASSENVLEWVKQDKRRMLHVVYRVGDLDRTIK